MLQIAVFVKIDGVDNMVNMTKEVFENFGATNSLCIVVKSYPAKRSCTQCRQAQTRRSRQRLDEMEKTI